MASHSQKHIDLGGDEGKNGDSSQTSCIMTPTPVLYQNDARDITLIDIPLSISTAQGISDDILLSSNPIAEPFSVNDPKSEAAKAKVGKQYDEELHAIYAELVSKALAEIKANISGDWCLPRKVMAQPFSKAKGAKGEAPSTPPVMDPEASLDQHLRSLQEETKDDLSARMASLNVSLAGGPSNAPWNVSYEEPHDASGSKASRDPGEPKSIQETWDWAFHNSYGQPLELVVSKAASESLPDPPKLTFKIPPKSTFFLHDCVEPTPFRTAFREITEDHRLPRHFNFVLLDPPWPNRSARRKGSYTTYYSVPKLKHMILKMDLDLYIEHDALVGIWITNKPALRDLVLGPGGLFKRLNVGLVEEWIWIKTTIKGEPILSMESVWRKPYEVLLLGRAANTSYSVAKPAQEIKRRVIAGVPDMHSRKPCLKDLIAPFMPDPDDYSALEIFPRHLVAGWASWGNEVLKFNWEGYWARAGTEASSVDVDVDTDVDSDMLE
ncbi:MT-A70-domain-containing protein [Mytilinidion resinicola]|uniref:MT-A70-domain-containing protein n=1 Tax=Mytilinidion resinicola TaxID=574789 RepID=A0A6A6YWW3_9PEZI|nr:MT-A70-domain-containing protein [Mytilinidion resinicola]KAF2813260.1 MT-A70-domain-containing protein [Mytilinidion resinicola]